MRLWALGTSPYGLGLTSEAFWSLTWREFDALKEVYDAPIERWAVEVSMFANAHFRDGNAAAWEPDDFLGKGKRAARNITKALDMRAVARENQRLSLRRPGDTAGLPEWAVN